MMRRKSVHHLGWTGYGNLGDEACLEVIGNLLRERLPQLRIRALSIREYGTGRRWRTQLLNRPDLVVVGGGTLLRFSRSRRSVVSLLRFYQEMEIPIVVFGSGFEYLSGCSDSAESPSFPDVPLEEQRDIKEVVESVKIIGVRGPDTVAALQALGVCREDLSIVGDPALALESAGHLNGEVLPEPFREGAIALNVGETGRGYHRDDAILQNEILVLARTLLESGKKVVLTALSEANLVIHQRLRQELGTHPGLFAVPKVLSSRETCGLLSRMDLVVAAKLHANIFAAAAGIPFVCVAYRPKGFDFARSLDWEYVLRSSEKDLAGQILTWIPEIMNRREGLVEALKTRVSSLRRRLNALADQVAEIIEQG